ncbi:hypothetical protein GCM10007416_00520 [Kroppenstedtia guangzhouensis]|uniref:Uncharacterized protein n=1 Tax=Kroppenstedtia guangzhouensis TaxID=1274356 RepID=A0ABQ1FVE5_9BACL|nr:hypothetical protein [Kroppenstedtia guangzhouensis]GGA31890.1 hypothetical protein GCM10007416_00520 [Kroppenstedtia guangzhouensis]
MTVEQQTHWKIGDEVTVPEYHSGGGTGERWKLTGERKGRVVYVGPRYIVVNWGHYEESIWLDDLAYRGSRSGMY